MKRAVLYPFLFVVYVVLNPLAGNLDQVDPSLALRPLIVLILATAAGMLLLYAVFKDWQYAGFLVFLLLAFFFVYGHLNRLTAAWLPERQAEQISLALLVAWGFALAVLGMHRLWRRFGSRGWLTPFFNITFMVALLVGPVTQVSAQLLEEEPAAQPDETDWLPDTSDSLALDCANRPDIYYLVLDAYGRPDVLDELYGVDGSAFVDYLERKGFYVANETHTNYIQTVFSIPSALNFRYLGPVPDGVSGRDYFSGLVANGRIMSALQSCGYETVAFESGFFFTNHPEADVYLTNSGDLNEFENLLLADTPVDVIADELDIDLSEHSYRAHRGRVLYTFDKLMDLPEMEGPQFVFAHILSPHPPFVFDAQGRAIEPARGYSIGDGNDYRGTSEEYAAGYAGQVQFVNNMLEQVIDAILEKSATPPIIIIQGDHGPGRTLDWAKPNASCLLERTTILNAYYLPDGGTEQLYASISPVNSFRVVLNAYFGAGLELLPDRTYFTSHRLPNQIIDITRRRDSARNCTSP